MIIIITIQIFEYLVTFSWIWIGGLDQNKNGANLFGLFHWFLLIEFQRISVVFGNSPDFGRFSTIYDYAGPELWFLLVRSSEKRQEAEQLNMRIDSVDRNKDWY